MKTEKMTNAEKERMKNIGIITVIIIGVISIILLAISPRFIFFAMMAMSICYAIFAKYDREEVFRKVEDNNERFNRTNGTGNAGSG